MKIILAWKIVPNKNIRIGWIYCRHGLLNPYVQYDLTGRFPRPQELARITVNQHRQFYTHILERLGIVSTAVNESILAPLSKPTGFSYSPRDSGPLDCFPHWWLGLAILSLACPDLAADQSPNSRTYKLHRYASQLKEHKTQHSNCTHAHCCSLYISHWWVEEACWAQILLSGTLPLYSFKHRKTKGNSNFTIIYMVWKFKIKTVQGSGCGS